MKYTKGDKFDRIKKSINPEDSMYSILRRDTASFEDETKQKGEIA